ncbi:MAG TPA: NAD(P)H-dependent oxidoreductase [Spongiibacteraceae bacterium]|nr:NAD(P)H-dependent oxidoreductase [Spongiibacteraceae bacterium]HCS26091.1 NAD(P)H-dependent oxidoreductase [Spongiibacteraceae bacterium]
MKVLGINGSLRRDSLNLKLLKAAGDYFSENVEFEILSLGDIPLYNQDLDGDNKPAAVVNLKQKISDADALVFATPEFNHSIPGALQNAIDWASRPAFNSPLTGKATGMLSASMSPIGGARAQAQLHTVMASALAPIFPSIEYLLGSAHTVFDASGAMTDETAATRLERYIKGFEEWLQQGG